MTDLLKIPGLGLDISTGSGAQGQIKFPAVQNASADPNTFDDYEESDSFTVTLNFGGATTGITYGSRTGFYTKKGREVTCLIRFTLTNKGSATGAATLTGLPFTALAPASCFFGYYDGLSGAGMPLGLLTGTTIALRYAAATTASTLTDTQCTNTTEMFLSVTYFV